ncbi:MAG: Hint domain-containing protein [Archangium sp.]
MSKQWLVTLSALAQLACPPQCIARGTPVKTPKGTRNIEALEVGDEITVVDPSSLEEHRGVITAVRSATRECARLGALRLTPSHPLFDTEKNEWAPAGDWLLGLRTHYATLDGPKEVSNIERFVGVDQVFDLTVDHPLHTFVADGVVVHNKQRLPPADGGCVDSFGAVTAAGTPCDCQIGTGVIECVGFSARCSCTQGPIAQSTTFYESKWFTVGDTDHSLLAATGANRLRCGPAPRALTVILGENAAWFTTESVLELRGTEPCFIDVDVTLQNSLWGHVWLTTVGFPVRAPGVLQLDGATLLEVVDSEVRFSPRLHANGGPAPSWRAVTSVVSWQRFEFQLEVLSPTTYRLWPKVLVYENSVDDASRFVATEPVGSTMTLADWYDAGNAFAFPHEADGGVRVLSIGQDQRDDAGFSVRLASFKLSSEGWVGE